MHECFCTFPSVILPNNVLSLRPERPHFHHFATKWNKFSTNKPAGPSLAVELSQSNAMSGGRWGWNQSYYYSPALQVCSPTSIFISRHSLIYFLQKMNSSPLTVNTRITKITNTEINYRARPRKSKCSLVSLLAAPIFTPIVWDGVLKRSVWQRQEIELIRCCTECCSLVFCGHGPSYYWLKSAASVSSSSPSWK